MCFDSDRLLRPFPFSASIESANRMANTVSASEPPTVFVLDGDSIVRQMISGLVRAMRLRCEAFVSGHEFLEAFDSSRPGCLVTEVRTPEVSGLEVQRRLAMLQASLPVVFLSAHATVPLIVRAMRLGATNFLEKPPSEHDLWEAIQEAIQEDERRRQEIEREKSRSEMISSLEPHEHRMLELIGQGVAMRGVAESLGVSVRTAEIRRCKLMQKLSMETHVELLRFAFSVLDGSSAASGEELANRWSGSGSLFSRVRSIAIM